MRVGPMFKWFGSKWQAAKRYPAPECNIIIEPYAGGAGYSLNYADKSVLIYDSNPLLIELWTWLIREATSDAVRDIPLNRLEGEEILSLGLSRGQSLLLKHWQRTNNYGNCWTISPWGSKPGQWTANTRARLAEEIHAIKHWRFAEPTWSETATWFIDPPYLYNYRYGATTFDHAALAARVHALPADAQIIACEAICPKTGAIPDYLPFAPSHESVTSRRKANQNHHSKELIYLRAAAQRDT